MGKMRGSSSPASSTALYPAMVAIEDSASMACARVVRGISSMAKAVKPAPTSGSMAAGSSSGLRKPTTTAPFFNCARSCAGGRFTASSTSAASSSRWWSEETEAPAAV